MSAKWRALQHRHRFTNASTIFPDAFLSSVRLLSASLPASLPASSAFLSAISSLPSLPTTFLQLPAATSLASSFPSLLSLPSLPPSAASAATRLYLEILFLDNSLPLHRTIISGIIKARNFLPLIDQALLSLFTDYAQRPGRRFAVSRAALSLLGYPKLGFLEDTLRNCALPAATDIIAGLQGVIRDVRDGSTPSPAIMEQCQEAMSCCYYLLQRFPGRFSKEDGHWSIFESLVAVTVEVLRSAAFSRDCLVAAGVCFWAALSVCCSLEELGCFISRGLFAFCSEDCKVELVELCGRDVYKDVGSMPTLSRLCLIRGMLTTVSRTLLNTQIRGFGGEVVWTILYDGILRELCDHCENPIDSHFNFHTLTVMQICFQQIKTSMQLGIVDRSGGYDPVPGDVSSRVLKIIWNNLEDPLSQTVKQVHLIFDLYLDVHTGFLSGEDNKRANMFLCGIASHLLCLGPRCKGRYVPLACCVRRLGAGKLLDMSPKLLYETVHAYVDDDVCCAATLFLKCFLELLRDECWSNDGIESGYEIFRGFCLPPLMQGLVSGQSKLRSNLNTYALPSILEVDVDSIFSMLAFISVGPKREEIKMETTVDQCVAILVALLKVSRLIALIEGDIDWDHESSPKKDLITCSAIVSIKGIHLKVPIKWFVMALTHADEHIRIDAAEALFLNPKTSSLPSSLELSLMRKAMPLNMRCCSTAFQMKWTSLFRKFFSRVKTALERQAKQGSWLLKKCTGQCQVGHCGDLKHVAFQRATELFSFMKWLSSHLFFSCYPSAPYERKTMAMALILILLDVWPADPPAGDGKEIYPYNEGFVSADATLLLVGSIIDSWDRLRESSYSILSRFPTPLPGICCTDSVEQLITWAKKLVCSPRVRESDAGALALRLIFKKYVVELGWIVEVSANVTCQSPQDKLQNDIIPILESKMPMLSYLSSIVEWLNVAVGEGEKDLSAACKNSFVHGILLALRYTFEELDWNSSLISSSTSEIKSVLEKLLDLIVRITSLALWVVSADAWYLPTDENDGIDDVDVMDTANGDLKTSDLSEAVHGGVRSADDVGPLSQVVMVGCWLAMKEVSLLLGTIARKIPLPGCSSNTDGINDSASEIGTLHEMPLSSAILNIKQLKSIGDHFLQVLLKMKHNGAIDKTRAGFTALCNRLLSSDDTRLYHMVEAWLEQLMERTIAKGQTVDDLLRRSAGIPAAFIALFLAEPEGTPKKLLPRALRWLIDVVNTSLPNSRAKYLKNGHMLQEISLEKLNQVTVKLSLASDEHRGVSKTRDEGVVPTVHSFNVLRAAFNDTNLAADTSGFAAEALIIAICSFSSPYWEVRNSACLAYTALVRRMIGFLNVHKRESARRALTGVEFFHRYPPLFPFLYAELKIATELLLDQSSEYNGSDMAKAIHPSLCPILILLSRLKPSLASSDPNDAYDPFLLLPFISRCAVQNNLRVRMLASRALTGLVSNERLPNVLVTIANALPLQSSHMTEPMDVHYRSFCSTNESIGAASALCSLTSFNAVHGILLQLTTLVNSNFRNLTDNSKKGEIFTELIPLLTRCSWLGNVQLCLCPTVNTSFLCILDYMLDIARTCKMESYSIHIQSLLEELSLQCLEKKKSSLLMMFDPTNVELKKQAASSYFSCLFGGNSVSSLFKLSKTGITSAEFQERIMFCLHNSIYEVRLATLKQIMELLKSMECVESASVIYLWVKSNLQPTMMHMVDVEDNFKCTYHILRIIWMWNLLQFEKYDGDAHLCEEIVYLGTMDFDSVFGFWKKLTHLGSTATHSKTREALVRCMAICTRQFTLFLRKASFITQSQVGESTLETSVIINYQNICEIFGSIDVFISLIKQHSEPSEPVDIRRATAESMVLSGLLKEVDFICLHVSNCKISSLEESSATKEIGQNYLHPSKIANVYARKVLETWSVCIHMLEDEDVGLREKLAHDVLSCITLSRHTDCHEVVPAQVERVIESCFEFLSLAFGHWIEYLYYLSQWCLEITCHTISHKDLIRQVFDKEIDNHHEEKLLICQICCMHLEKLVSSSSVINVESSGIGKDGVMSFIQRWRLKFLQQLIDVGSGYLEAGGRSDWIGGMGNHKDVFVAIYGNLLGLYALSQFDGDDTELSENCDLGKQFSSGFDNMRAVLQPFLKNSLIFNLYSLLLQSQDKLSVHSIGNLSPIKQCSDWEDFDPYFLLR